MQDLWHDVDIVSEEDAGVSIGIVLTYEDGVAVEK